MKSAVIRSKDNNTVEIVYEEGSFTEKYIYKIVQGKIDGNDIIESILIPKNEKSKSPPEYVVKVIKQRELKIHPKSRVDIIVP